ncbi:MAG: DUF4159 domain-containing protein [Saprospiraceae bacterium]|nr:DUF4159 domain-containing protein [Saprospiraceae bacterium]MBK8451452.1 DUF4159 domain-containing protein [Saprospiraceae bacterium]MBK8483405.1 DUF4159 domain-containing protein [Saprospiraceae bacterium]MBK9220916.1 DUF4159 domain-containing protein [Saprospiraceae bacterium]MBK9722239.1 DUF4159 domain-containing protein [Saprospiraceae bacterium]
MKYYYLLILTLSTILFSFIEPTSLPMKLALLKYNGGGDWYANPTSLLNLAKFCNKEMHTNFDINYATVEVGSAELFNYPFIHMTGHGNVVFSDFEAQNLRTYLLAGGFLHIDDNYGMDPFVRPSMKKVFPELDFIELPFTHPIFKQKYNFPNGLPKIHEHDKKPAQGFGLIYQGRLLCFYSFECDLGDGWEDREVHKDPEETRMQALKMGANLISYVFLN